MDANRFSIFEKTDWSAAEELNLLSAIEEFGYGNWLNISRRITTRSPESCQHHYDTFYINNPSEFLPILPTTKTILPCILTPFNYRLKNIDEPPRQLPNDSMLAGYSASRSDFEHPYDSNAECLITELSKHIQDCDSNLKTLVCGVIQAYNNRLRERHRRYKVMQTHGLIVNRKSSLYGHENTLSRPVFEKFLGYAQLMSANDFNFILHSLNRQMELKTYLYQLKEMRRIGIRTLYGYRLFKKLKVRRNQFNAEIKSYFERPEMSVNIVENINVANVNKRTVAPPLDIIGLPDYNRLTEDEKLLCSTIRLVPTSYLEFKRVLIGECEKMGGLRLQDARKAIHIDVNKTRKLYDFLCEKGHISKPTCVSL